ncbi:MAG: SpoIIE family protein phosphatase [Ignavibacteria bacterium]|jgi:sigma-B regulation protein RsbU (phosphoserine phosphatase)
MQSVENNNALRNLSALVDFSSLINSSLDINLILNNILLTCFGKFHTTKGLIALVNKESKLEIKLHKGLKKQEISDFPLVDLTDSEDGNILRDYLSKHKYPLCQKIYSSDKLLGIIVLGEKLNKVDYSNDDKNFLKTIQNIGATAIENSLSVEELKFVNRHLDSKVNQLSSLFDLSKEFSGILKIETVSKLLVFSIIGQLFVSKFAVLIHDGKKFEILESKIKNNSYLDIINNSDSKEFKDVVKVIKPKDNFPQLYETGVRLIIPMKIKGETKGIILLGSRMNNLEYSQSDIEYASSLGSLAIISIENSRLFDEALEKQKMEKDLEIARRIQSNLLPDRVPELKNFEIAAYNRSAKQVGGDYYDIVMLDGNRTTVAIADVSGKGVQAALLMANMQAFLQSISKQNIELVKASNLINDLVSENTVDGSFITFFWGVLNDSKKEFSYVNAGHNPPLLIRNGKITKLKMGGMILGVMATVIPYKTETIVLEKDDLIILFTDGVTEAMDKDFNEYSDERLEKFVTGIEINSAEEILNSIKQDVFSFTRGADQSDDITCLVIKVK